MRPPGVQISTSCRASPRARRLHSTERHKKFDGYFYGRLYLDGTVNADGRITGANSINIRLVKGAKWALATNDFSFTNIDWWGKPVLLTATIGGEEVRHWVTFYDPYA